MSTEPLDPQINWLPLGSVAPKDVVGARLQAHFAAQIASGFGRTHVPKKDDDSHTALYWQRGQGGLHSHASTGANPLNAVLEFSPHRLTLVDGSGAVRSTWIPNGNTLDEGYQWLSAAIAEATAEPETPITALHYEMPDHELSRGAAFRDGLDDGIAEIGKWIGNAHHLLVETVGAESSASEIICWPHHFDIATLVDLGEGRSIGIGLSAGDSSYAEPYWYVSPYPYPKPEDLPALGDKGHWHTEGFTAAILEVTDVVDSTSAHEQHATCKQFLQTAIAAGKKAIGI
jgi:hypothetical protein